MKEITQSLLKVQQEVDGVTRNKKNEYLNYNYADLTSVIEACQSVFNKHGIFVTQGFDYDADGRVFFVTTRLMHESGEELSNTIGFPIDKKDPQSIGSLCTYGRRYGLSAIIGITQYDDDAHSSIKWRTEDQIKEFSEKLKHEAFKGYKPETKKWWKDKNKHREAEQGLKKMQEKIDTYESTIETSEELDNNFKQRVEETNENN